MNLFTKQLRIVALSALFVVGAVCTSGGAEKPTELVGQWVLFSGVTRDKPEEIELFSDGTGVIDGKFSMTWKVENKRLMLLTSSRGIVCDYKVSDYELTLIYGEYNSAMFVKKEKWEEYKEKEMEERQKNMERLIEEKLNEAERLGEATLKAEELLKAERLKKEAEAEKKKDPLKKEAEQRFAKISSYFTDSRDGQKYRTVNMGGKTWMAENLNHQPKSGNSWCYEGNDSNCDKYGRLYDWNTAKVVCPAGWHLPSREEWKMLGFLDKKFKSTYGWDKNGNGTDDFGFSAMPGGYRNRNKGGYFKDAGRNGYWWTATRDDDISGAYYSRNMGFRSEDSNGGGDGLSVRCVAD